MDISFISYKHLTASGSSLPKNNTNTGSFGSGWLDLIGSYVCNVAGHDFKTPMCFLLSITGTLHEPDPEGISCL
ncbi:hypothetical protein OQ279_07800 [Salinimicrobium sp. MT39]|uniref:Uncharacterized protein n=1 Tax=Salinimicrobium profundisediminis TaxID=2994553 RepID=A0A9X3I1L7_9FLAO|nr:hypothetical protein [Salinimicrobium profundisediminis]MCX2838057.1 hypothetical protein [Salinimicrobium profundisediminis]